MEGFWQEENSGKLIYREVAYSREVTHTRKVAQNPEVAQNRVFWLALSNYCKI